MKKKSRPLVVCNLARELMKKIDVKEFAPELKTSMEISHFLATVNNLLAIMIFNNTTKKEN